MCRRSEYSTRSLAHLKAARLDIRPNLQGCLGILVQARAQHLAEGGLALHARATRAAPEPKAAAAAEAAGRSAGPGRRSAGGAAAAAAAGGAVHERLEGLQDVDERRRLGPGFRPRLHLHHVRVRLLGKLVETVLDRALLRARRQSQHLPRARLGCGGGQGAKREAPERGTAREARERRSAQDARKPHGMELSPQEVGHRGGSTDARRKHKHKPRKTGTARSTK